MHQEVHGETGAFFYFPGRQIDVQRQPVGSPLRARCARIAALRRISRYYLTGVDQVLESVRRCRRATDRNDTDDKAAEITGVLYVVLTGPYVSPAGPSRNVGEIISNLEHFSSLST